MIHCVLMSSLLFCYTVTVDAVMANSRHQSPLTSVEVLPFAAAGDKLESPLLASEEGAEWKLKGSEILVYRFTSAQNHFFFSPVHSLSHVSLLSSLLIQSHRVCPSSWRL